MGCDDATVLFKALEPVLFTDAFLLARGRLETVVVAGVTAGLLIVEGPAVLGFLFVFPKSSALRFLTPTLVAGVGGTSLEGRAIPLLGIPLIFEEIEPFVFFFYQNIEVLRSFRIQFVAVVFKNVCDYFDWSAARQSYDCDWLKIQKIGGKFNRFLF